MRCVNLLDAMAGYGAGLADHRQPPGGAASRWSRSCWSSSTKAESGPGALVSLERVGEYISVRVPDIEGALELPPEVAAHVFVTVG